MTNEELVKLVQEGHNELMADLYKQNKPVIRMIAQKLTHNPDEYEDALQDAYFGFIAAVDAYDAHKGYKFITYASYHIRTAINRGKTTVQPIPEYLIYEAAKIRKAESELSHRLQRTPTTAEIAAVTGFTVEEIKYTLKAIQPPKSIETPLADDLTIADTIPDDDIDFENEIAEASEKQYIKQVVHNAIYYLKPQEQRVIRLYFLQGMSYKDIANIIGVSTSRVQRIARDAIIRLNNSNLKQQLLDAAVDIQVNYYQHRGVQTFNNTWISSTEQTVLDREYYTEKYKAAITQ